MFMKETREKAPKNNEGFAPIVKDWLDQFIMSQMGMRTFESTQESVSGVYSRLWDYGSTILLAQRIGADWERWFGHAQRYVKSMHGVLGVDDADGMNRLGLRLHWAHLLGVVGMLESSKQQINTVFSQLIGVRKAPTLWERDVPVKLLEVRQYPEYNDELNARVSGIQIQIAALMFERGLEHEGDNLIGLTEMDWDGRQYQIASAEVKRAQMLSQRRGQVKKVTRLAKKYSQKLFFADGGVDDEMVHHASQLTYSVADTIRRNKGVGAACDYLLHDQALIEAGLNWMTYLFVGGSSLTADEEVVVLNHLKKGYAFLRSEFPQFFSDQITYHCQLLMAFGQRRIAGQLWRMYDDKLKIDVITQSRFDLNLRDTASSLILASGIMQDDHIVDYAYSEYSQLVGDLPAEQLTPYWRALSLAYVHLGKYEKALAVKGMVDDIDERITLDIDYFLTRLFCGEVDDIPGEISACIDRISRIDQIASMAEEGYGEDEEYFGNEMLRDWNQEETLLLDHIEYLWLQLFFLLREKDKKVLRQVWDLIDLPAEKLVRMLIQSGLGNGTAHRIG